MAILKLANEKTHGLEAFGTGKRSFRQKKNGKSFQVQKLLCFGENYFLEVFNCEFIS